MPSTRFRYACNHSVLLCTYVGLWLSLFFADASHDKHVSWRQAEVTYTYRPTGYITLNGPSVQNAAARLITNQHSEIWSHHTGVAWSALAANELFSKPLCWSTSVRLHGLPPSYLTEFCRPVTNYPGRRKLPSGTTGVLRVPRTRTSIGGPVARNSLPAELRTPNCLLRRLPSDWKCYWLQPAACSLQRICCRPTSIVSNLCWSQMPIFFFFLLLLLLTFYSYLSTKQSKNHKSQITNY